jgi:pantoate--beta-alanine ligase
MNVVGSKDEIRALVAAWRKAGERVAIVPTMGALHEGHLSLVDVARAHATRVVATIFVNPLQFAPGEDFETYPRDFEGDLSKLKERGCDACFTPERKSLFADDFSTTVSVAGVGENHCSLTRPHFFDGVATIVTKLLMITRPDIAVFGEKDFQQLAVIRRFVRDLDIDVEIIGAPIVREPDGLAMSSRNLYMSESERAAAPALFSALSRAADAALDAPWPDICAQVEVDLRAAGFGKIDYINLVARDSLVEIDRADRPARILAAAWMGDTRLIDNVAAGPSMND